MFEPSFVKRARSWLPDWLYRRLDPFEASIDDFVQEIARSCSAGERVLDAGAGQSRFAPRFAHTRYTAVDLATGDSAWDYSSITARADLERLPFLAGVFDRALCIVVLEHTREPARVLQELARVLVSGGRAYLVVPLMWEVHQAQDYFRFTSQGITWLAQTARLEVVDLRPIGGLFWVLSRRSMALLAFFARGLLWPVFVLLAPFLGLAIPLLFYWMDRFDKVRDYTLGYRVELKKN